MRFTKMTLYCRLRLALGQRVALEAPGFCSESGRLQQVGPRFIKVSGQLLVSHNLDRIILFRHCHRARTCQVTLRTTYEETIRARLIQIGLDFIEIAESHAMHRRQVIIPLEKVVSIERA